MMKEGAAAGASLAHARSSVTVLMRSLALLRRETTMLSWLPIHGNARVRLADIIMSLLQKWLGVGARHSVRLAYIRTPASKYHS